MISREQSLEHEMAESDQPEEAIRESQERLSLAIAAANLGMWDRNLVSDEWIWSRRCFELFGLSPGTQMTHQRFLAAIHPEDRDRIEQAIRTAVERHEDFDVEARVVWPNGTVCYLAARGHAYYDPAGRPMRMMGIAWDITQRKLAQRQLAQQAMLLDLAPVLVLDLDCHIVYWSPGIEKLYGWSQSEAHGIVSYELLQTSFPVPLEQIRDKFLREGSWEGELLHTRKDGEHITVASLWVLQRDSSGQPIAILEVNNDITRLRQAEEAVRQSQERLSLAMAAANLGMWDRNLVSDEWIWSPRCLELFGLSPETQMTHQRFLAAIHPEDRDRIEQAICTAVERHEDFDVEARVVWPNGAVRHLAARGHAYYDPSGHPVRMTGVAADITQRKLIESQLAQQAMLLDLAPFLVLDLDYHIVFWSRGMEMLYGWSRAEARGLFADKLLQTSFPAPLEHIRDKLFREGSWEGELIHTRKDGEHITVACLWVLQRDASGQPMAILEINNDVTQRRQAEDAVRQSHERLSLAIAAANLGMWDWDIVSDEAVWSPRCFELFGAGPRPRMTYQHFLETIHPEDRERIDRAVRTAVEQHEDYQAEMRIVAPDGTVRYIVSRGRANYDPLGRPTRMIGVAIDITARKQAENALLATKEELARANQDLEAKVKQRTAKLQEAMGELEHMSYSMIHDLRAPLRAMNSFATLLEEEYAGSLPTEGADYCRLIRKSATRMDHLVTDALNYNRVVHQDFPLMPVEVGSLLRGMIETYPDLRQSVTDIAIEFNELVVSGNPSLLTQCFGNLLCNAVKFVAQGVKPRVRVRAEARNEVVRIWVEDNGIGISEDAQKKIFGMFQRMHHESEYPGTGIGLAIVRKAVERMGGRVGLESEPGKGSKFWIELPNADEAEKRSGLTMQHQP